MVFLPYLLHLTVLIVLVATVDSHSACQDYTIGDCTVSENPPFWESGQLQSVAQCQVACHSFQSCQVFR